MEAMHSVDLVDETFIAARASSVATAVADPRRWRAWWPDRRVEVFMDRGVKGQRWAVAGDLVGSSEIWLEEFRDGVVLHYFLRADPSGGPEGRRAADRRRRNEALAWKRIAWALKHEFEGDRVPGTAGA